jgi:hypothetical protein
VPGNDDALTLMRAKEATESGDLEIAQEHMHPADFHRSAASLVRTSPKHAYLGTFEDNTRIHHPSRASVIMSSSGEIEMQSDISRHSVAAANIRTSIASNGEVEMVTEPSQESLAQAAAHGEIKSPQVLAYVGTVTHGDPLAKLAENGTVFVNFVQNPPGAANNAATQTIANLAPGAAAPTPNATAPAPVPMYVVANGASGSHSWLVVVIVAIIGVALGFLCSHIMVRHGHRHHHSWHSTGEVWQRADSENHTEHRHLSHHPKREHNHDTHRHDDSPMLPHSRRASRESHMAGHFNAAGPARKTIFTKHVGALGRPGRRSILPPQTPTRSDAEKSSSDESDDGNEKTQESEKSALGNPELAPEHR